MNKNVLVISPLAFHKNVGNAGAKTVNFYVQRLISESVIRTAIAYLGDENDDYLKMVSELGNTEVFVSFSRKNLIKKTVDFIKFKYIYPNLRLVFPKYYVTDDFAKSRMSICLEKVKSGGFVPDVIIVEFPRLIYWIALIKRFFPEAKTVASCHDVTFLSVQRYLEQKCANRYFSAYYYHAFKRKEIDNLNFFDHVLVLNLKDKLLLLNEVRFTNKSVVILSPYFDYYERDYSTPKSHVLYFAAMIRTENIHAAKWFIENVWVRLIDSNNRKLRIKIIGGGLPEKIKHYFLSFQNVDIEGFVKDPTSLFNQGFCLVVPLKMGAGIKIKVLDAMNSGIPVVTNSIGIEGIPATNGIDYLHAESAEEFYEQVLRLKMDVTLQQTLGNNSRALIKENFDVDASYVIYRNLILS